MAKHFLQTTQVQTPSTKVKPSSELDVKKEIKYEVDDKKSNLNEVSTDCKITIEYQDNKKKRSFILIDETNDLENNLVSSNF